MLKTHGYYAKTFRGFALMKTARTLLIGVSASIWTGLVGLLVVPLYVKYLGIASYGLIGFFATAQVLLQLLDFGLSPTLNRELARCSAAGEMVEARSLLRTLELLYWGTAFFIALFIAAVAPLVARHWLQSQHVDQYRLSNAVLLLGIVVACRWPLGLYQGALMGMQRLAVASTISAFMQTIANLGAVAVLALISPSIEAFFIWQASMALIQAVLMRHAAWRVVGSKNGARFEVALLRRIWRFSAGMSGIALSSILLTQVDKVLLSKLLSLEDFGRYSLAGALAAGLYVLLTPVFNVIYPRMVTLVVKGDNDGLLVLYKNGTRLLASVLLPIAISVAFYSRDLVQIWTGNPDLAIAIAPIVSLLVLGTACNGVMHFPYALQLAFGLTRLPLTITTLLASCLVPLVVVLTLRYGPTGSAAAWFVTNIAYLFVGTWLTHRQLLRGEGTNWLICDIGLPFVITLAITFLGWQSFRVDNGGIANLVPAIGFGLVAILANGLSFPKAMLSDLRDYGLNI